ncbi:MAG: toast rack family protein [Candidatus Acidiferrales bacterium]
MAQGDRPRRESFTGALVVVAVGVFFLIVNLRPEPDLWWYVLSRYWPVILIVVGLGKMWDAWLDHAYPDPNAPRHHSGAPIAVLVIALVLGLALWRGRTPGGTLHETQAIPLQGAQSVTANIEIPAGSLDLSAGAAAAQLLDVDFNYHQADGRPHIDYSVANGRGDLNITQENDQHLRLAAARNDWRLRLADNVPLDLHVRMGAGESNLSLRGLNVTNLDVNIGAGHLKLDLTGPRKTNLNVVIHGGVGAATIRLPRDVGVRVHASGGIGAVDSGGLSHDGDDYVNAMLGKTPATIDVSIEGGVGAINLQLE